MDRKEYVSPEVKELGTPAEICRIQKILPDTDLNNLTFSQSVPGETSGS